LGSGAHWGLADAGARRRDSGLAKGLAFFAFAGLLLSTVALNSFKIRGGAAIGVLGLLLIFYLDLAKEVLRRNALLLGFGAAIAMLGIFVSLVNNAPLGVLARAVTEVHIQAAITIMVAATLAQICGARAAMWAIVGVVGLSALVATAQAMDIEPAWMLRRALGPFANEELDGMNLGERRAPGLSYSPIQLSTQLCLALAVFLAVRDKFRSSFVAHRTADPMVIPALLVMFGACVACATRSPILGGVIFLGLYALHRRTTWLALMLALGAVVLYLAWPLLLEFIQGAAPRLARTDDNSANARSTLVYYGLRLFADNPLGYGLSFAPMTMWMPYWPDIYMMQAPRGVRENDLHNYVINMINMYGVGLLLLIPIAVKLLRGASASLIFFVPYVIQILFHNAGPFYNDNVIWFVFAAIAAVPAANRSTAAAGGAGQASSLRHRADSAPQGSGAAASRVLRPHPRVKRPMAGAVRPS
jgi:hypothetical protein